jgi:hypothetical protein
MNLPFGFPTGKDIIIRKREDLSDTAVLYERKLAEYRDTLENYRKCILDYNGKLEGYDKKSLDSQLSIIQTALDLTYLKEQGEKTAEFLQNLKEGSIHRIFSQLENLTTALVDTNYQIQGLDKNAVNRLSELIQELQKQSLVYNKQLHTELESSLNNLNNNIQRGNTLLGFIVVLNVLGLSGIVFLVLYIMDIIPF